MLQNRGVTCGVLRILTWKCAGRHSRVQFLDIWPSKSGPNMWCFAHFDLQMCFAPQRRTIFGHLTFRKWSEHVVFCAFWLTNVLRAKRRTIFEHRNFKTCSERVVFCAFWLANVLRATAVYHFCGSELPKLPRDFGVSDQKWQNRSRHEVFCIVWLENVLRAVAILHRSAEQLPPHPPL